MAHPSRGAGLAMSLSLAVHVLLALVFFFMPGPARRMTVDTRVMDDRPGVALSLAELTSRAPPAAAASGEEEQDYKVVEANPSPSPAAPVEVQAPIVVGRPGGRPGAAGTGGSEATGSGTSPGARPSLLDAPQQARRVVYVLDRSLSMGPSRALNRARQELLNALARLPAGATFQVILYNLQAETLRIDGNSGYLPADESTRAAVARALERTAAAGSTNHVNALRQGLFLRPDVLFLVTDADELTDREVQDVARFNTNRTAIHVIELTRRRADADGPLHRLATLTGGSYRSVTPE